MTITLKPNDIYSKNLYFLLFLLAANLLGIFSKLNLGHDQIYGLVPLFDFNTEKNIPTLYSSIALLVASGLLAFIATKNRQANTSYIPWLGLSLIFAYLSIDETASIHESSGQAIKQNFVTSGAVFYAWVIPYSVAVAIFAAVYAKFVFNLPKSSRNLFVASGVIYVVGAMGFEILGGYQFQISGTWTWNYCLLYTCEEFLEMLGIALFNYALLRHIVEHFGDVGFAVTTDDAI